ncbi:MAG: PIG-L family deacetylase [Bacteroidetes bacterium]|nr:PIG-L family deacetylase [Bacteroidota bacterium]
MKSMIITAALALTLSAAAQDVPHTLDPAMYRAGNDIPAGVAHGTWDFDEWPGVDHKVVYVKDFMYGDGGNEKIKIDYHLSVFDADDHTGYLRTPDVLAERFTDMNTVINSAKTIIVIMAHPDDEVLLTGGLIAASALKGKNVKVFLLSNGADGSMGFEDDADAALGGYNCAGVMPDGSVRVATDLMGLQKPQIARRYGRALGVDISVLPVRYQLNGKQIVQIGEYMGFDFKKSFGPGSVMREAMQKSIEDLIFRERPDLVITHGTDGEYGNYFHKTVHVLVKNAVQKAKNSFNCTLFTGFPEYNYSDHITHFLDLDADGGQARSRKYSAFKGISYVFKAGNDYDKPWNPNDDLMDGVFVKDYGYTPTDGRPPRYEFYQKVD